MSLVIGEGMLTMLSHPIVPTDIVLTLSCECLRFWLTSETRISHHEERADICVGE